MDIVIFDTEIKHGIATENNPRHEDYIYANGWDDFSGMGIACVCAYDIKEARPHVFLEDNLHRFAELVEERGTAMGFNSHRFDGPLLAANGIDLSVQKVKHLDLAAIIWRACGIQEGEHPKGLGLDALCRANGISEKSENAASVPQLWQDGHFGRVIDYCIGDVLATLRLYRHLCSNSGILVDPRNGNWINVQVPR